MRRLNVQLLMLKFHWFSETKTSAVKIGLFISTNTIIKTKVLLSNMLDSYLPQRALLLPWWLIILPHMELGEGSLNPSLQCTCIDFACCIVLLHMCCIIVTWWGGPGKIEA